MFDVLSFLTTMKASWIRRQGFCFEYVSRLCELKNIEGRICKCTNAKNTKPILEGRFKALKTHTQNPMGRRL